MTNENAFLISVMKAFLFGNQITMILGCDVCGWKILFTKCNNPCLSNQKTNQTSIDVNLSSHLRKSPRRIVQVSTPLVHIKNQISKRKNQPSPNFSRLKFGQPLANVIKQHLRKSQLSGPEFLINTPDVRPKSVKTIGIRMVEMRNVADELMFMQR